MNLGNKKLLTIIILLMIVSSGIHKYIYGFSPVGYIYNFYQNVNSKYITQSMFPKFFWHIVKSDNKKIVYESFMVNNKVISATLDIGYRNKSITEIEQMCEGKNNIAKIADGYSILCRNERNSHLLPYKIVYKPNSYFLFMYDYNDKYDWIYEKLIDYIKYRGLGDNDNPHLSPL